MNTDSILQEILEKIEQGTAMQPDFQRLRQLINDDKSGKSLDQVHLYNMQKTSIGTDYDPHNWQKIIQQIIQVDRMNEAVTIPNLAVRPAHRIHFLKTTWFRYAAAVIILFGIGAYLYNTQKKNTDSAAVQPPSEKDIAPGGNKAILVLGDESVVSLDSLKTGTSMMQGGMQIIKSADGEITYVPIEANDDQGVVFTNTMKTPRGGQYQLTLPDGTQVWLNAASSITYPTRFVGPQRNVRVAGEAYFQVVKNKEKPFIVKTRTDEIRVLGTVFNVNAYADEGSVQTSLLEGRVQVTTNGTLQLLKPGQQVANGIVKKVDLKSVVAWKQGNFYFDDQDLKTILRQFARWYDVEVVYEGNLKNRTFFGIVKRSQPLSHVLTLLEDNDIKFQINGKKLIVQSD